MLRLVKARKEKIKAVVPVELRHIRLTFSLGQKIGFWLIVISLVMSGLKDGLEFFGFLGLGDLMDWLHPTTDMGEGQ